MQEITYDFRENDLIHFNETHIRETEDYKKNVKRNRVLIPGVVVLVGLFYWSYYKDAETLAFAVLVALIWSLLIPRITRWDWKRQIMRLYTPEQKAGMFGRYRLRIEPQFLVEYSPSGEHRYPWAEVLSVEYQPGYVYLYVDVGTALIIPRETAQGDYDAFARSAQEMIERATRA